MNSIPLLAQRAARRSFTSAMTSRGSKTESMSSSRPASTLERSRMSLMMARSASPERRRLSDLKVVHLGDALARIEDGVDELEPARLDLGEIEDVVDDGKERFARAAQIVRSEGRSPRRCPRADRRRSR